MAVYVDYAAIPYRGMLMSHLMADTTEELLAMADAIGVQRRWIQKAGEPEEHFDVADSKRQLAVRRGAQEVDGRFLVELVQQRRAARAGAR